MSRTYSAEQRAALVALYHKHGTLDAVIAADTGIPRRDVQAIIRQELDRLHVPTRTKPKTSRIYGRKAATAQIATDPIVLSWLAGVIESKVSIVRSGRRKESGECFVSGMYVMSTQASLPRAVAEAVGTGSLSEVTSERSKSTSVKWLVTNPRDVLLILRAVAPYLRVRSRRIALAIEELERDLPEEGQEPES